MPSGNADDDDGLTPRRLPRIHPGTRRIRSHRASSQRWKLRRPSWSADGAGSSVLRPVPRSRSADVFLGAAPTFRGRLLAFGHLLGSGGIAAALGFCFLCGDRRCDLGCSLEDRRLEQQRRGGCHGGGGFGCHDSPMVGVRHVPGHTRYHRPRRGGNLVERRRAAVGGGGNVIARLSSRGHARDIHSPSLSHTTCFPR